MPASQTWPAGKRDELRILTMSAPSVGVEEAFLLVDPGIGEPVARNADVAGHAAERGWICNSS